MGVVVRRDFNYDYQASAVKDADGKVYYNYTSAEFPAEEMPGASVFYRARRGDLPHLFDLRARARHDAECV